MAFGFAAPDYLTRAQAGMPLDPTAPDQSPVPAAPIAAAPQADPTAQLPQPGMWDILQNMLFKGESPADAAMAVRQRDYQVRTMQRTAAILPTLPAPLQAAAMMGGPKVWEEIAKNYGPQTRSAGQQTDYMGGANHGGYTASTGTVAMDDKSGIPTLAGPDGAFQRLSPSLGGDFSVSPTGAVLSGRTGLTGQTVSLPQILAPGSVPNTFKPPLSGPGLPNTQPAPISATPHPSSIVNAQGALDPAAFYRSFVLPHEGGLNPRDLNGSPTKYGINAASNPDIDLNKLTLEGAATVFATKYFPASGAAQLPPALAAVHADTSFINPAKAQEFLKASGGDPNKYMDLRDAWMSGLVQKYPAAQKYAQAWSNRNADLRSVAASLGGAQPQGQGTSAPGFSGPPAKTPTLLAEGDPRLARFPKGTVVQQNPNGELAVVQQPEYSPAERSKIRQQFLESEGYKGHIAASSALQALTQNIGKMTGPAAYSILDTFARTINPGAVARQGTLSAIEDSLGLPAHIVGGLQNMVGQGKIPLQTQQQILNAVTPFAQAHYDQAKSFYDANTALAKARGFDPDEVTAPIGERPKNMIAAPGGAISQDAALEQARAALHKGADRALVIQRLHNMGVDPRGL